MLDKMSSESLVTFLNDVGTSPAVSDFKFQVRFYQNFCEHLTNNANLCVALRILVLVWHHDPCQNAEFKFSADLAHFCSQNIHGTELEIVFFALCQN